MLFISLAESPPLPFSGIGPVPFPYRVPSICHGGPQGNAGCDCASSNRRILTDRHHQFKRRAGAIDRPARHVSLAYLP
jgi:hypothetical protein